MSAPLTFFDTCIGVGPSGTFTNTAKTAPELLAMLNSCGVTDALVYDRHAVELGDFSSPDRARDFCASSEHLRPLMLVGPTATREGPPPDEIVDIMREGRYGGAIAWPVMHRFDFAWWSMGRLCERFERSRIPLFVSFMQAQDHPWEHRTDWPAVRETALAFPSLPIIVPFMGMLEGRRAFPVLEECANVMTDLTCVSFQYLEEVVDRFGPERLLLASNHPFAHPSLYCAWITYSALSPEAKYAVARGNVERLLEGIV